MAGCTAEYKSLLSVLFSRRESSSLRLNWFSPTDKSYLHKKESDFHVNWPAKYRHYSELVPKICYL